MQLDNTKKQKEVNKLGWLFIITMVMYLLASVTVSVISQNGVELNSTMVLMISEIVLVAPTIIFIVIKKLKWREDLGFNKLKVSTFFLSILLGIFVIPILSFANILSQLFVPNTAVQAIGALAGEGSNAVILAAIVGFVGPFVEELIMRGLVANGLAKYSTPLKALLISALLFGLMHLNINQFCYAILLGGIGYIANRASGSTYSSLIVHIVVNSVNVFALLAMSFASTDGAESVVEGAEAMRNSSEMMIMMLLVYGVLAIICAAIVFGLLIGISQIANRKDALKATFSGNIEKSYESELVEIENKKVRALLNVPMIIAIVLCVVLTFGTELFM